MSPPRISAVAVSKRYGEQRRDALSRLAETLRLREPGRPVQALQFVSLDVQPGEVLGIVGESGCGKSTFGRILAGLEEPDTGHLEHNGAPLNGLDRRARKKARLGTQLIFQDPWASLNPRLRVGDIVGEAPLVHGMVSRSEVADFAASMLRRVGLGADYLYRYPHELSGGQRQRVSIARALAVSPDVLICDEAVSALDVSIQAQILKLFRQLRRDLGVAIVFISHDLNVVNILADRVAVMYLGRVVELGTARQVYDSPRHPYSQALIANAPRLTRQRREFTSITGEVPSPYDPPRGCAFHTRCPKAIDRCRMDQPPDVQLDGGHVVACHLYATAPHR